MGRPLTPVIPDPVPQRWLDVLRKLARPGCPWLPIEYPDLMALRDMRRLGWVKYSKHTRSWSVHRAPAEALKAA